MRPNSVAMRPLSWLSIMGTSQPPRRNRTWVHRRYMLAENRHSSSTNQPLRTVDECVAHVAEQLSGSGVRLCYRIDSPAERSKYADMGVTVFLERLG